MCSHEHRRWRRPLLPRTGGTFHQKWRSHQKRMLVRRRLRMFSRYVFVLNYFKRLNLVLKDFVFVGHGSGNYSIDFIFIYSSLESKDKKHDKCNGYHYTLSIM